MRSYRETLEPYASAWRMILYKTVNRGLIHGMEAFQIIQQQCPHSCRGPADAAIFLRDMVEVGALRPVAKDLAGAGHSVLAFRSLQHLRESQPPVRPSIEKWSRGMPSESADAHLWTFEAMG